MAISIEGSVEIGNGFKRICWCSIQAIILVQNILVQNNIFRQSIELALRGKAINGNLCQIRQFRTVRDEVRVILGSCTASERCCYGAVPDGLST